eukprot:Nk52_evm1s424 gene=Nk52_evmTU1s424
MLRKLYKPFACQILEPIYFKKHAIDAVKKNPQDSQVLELHKHDEERWLMMVRILNAYLYANCASYAADKRRKIVAQHRYEGVEVEEGKIAEKNEAWDEETENEMERRFQANQVVKVTTMRNNAMANLGRNQGWGNYNRGGRGRGRHRGGYNNGNNNGSNNDKKKTVGGAEAASE